MPMKKVVIQYMFLLSLFFCLPGIAQSFSASKIAPDLMEDANAVLRLEETNVELSDIDKMKVSSRTVITVLNRQGDRYRNIRVYYRKTAKVKSIKATVYDAKGNEIKRFKKKDFSDLSAVSGGTLYSDVRYLSLNYTPISYPYTMEFEYELVNESTGFVPNWTPVSGPYLSLEKSVFTVGQEKDLGLKYKLFNFEDYPNVSLKKSGNLHVFTAENLPAYRYEAYQPSLEEFLPFAYVGLEKFNLHGVKAEVRNWEDFGNWMYANLIKDRNQVSEKTRMEVLALVEGVDDPIERAKIVYKYVQDNMRYIDVVIGIGGWEPIDAIDVDRVKYGDCKGLTNYTHALLKLVGVESYWTVLWSDEIKTDLYEDFASIQGNHMILNIPQEGGEDIWLECTSSYLPFGYVTPSNGDRNVLVIKESGSGIKKSTSNADDNNLQLNTNLLRIDENGNLQADVQKKSYGYQFSDRYYFEILSRDDAKKRYLNSWSDVPKLSVNSFDFTKDEANFVFYENISVNSEGFAKKMGNRMMFSINPFNASVGAAKKYKTRTTPFKISRGYKDEDVYIIELPNGYKVEALPENTELVTDFGQFSLHFEVEENKLKVNRVFQLNSGYYTKDSYEDFRLFMLETARLDGAKAVISKG